MSKCRCTPDQSAHPEQVEILHHFLCAYVGPAYDFASSAKGRICPKCARCIDLDADSWEVVGHSLICQICGSELALPE